MYWTVNGLSLFSNSVPNMQQCNRELDFRFSGTILCIMPWTFTEDVEVCLHVFLT